MLELADLQTVVTAILKDKTLIRQASLDIAKITALPAVWVEYVSSEPNTIDGGAAVSLRLYPVVADRDPVRVLGDLADVLLELGEAVRRFGPLEGAEAVTVTVPGQGPLPGLRVPLTIHTTP